MARNVWNYKLWGHCKVRHHLLEIILWPNDDGTFKKIINTADDLKRLGVYDDYKMTIEITNSEHTTMHNHNRDAKVNNKISASLKGRPSPMKGKACPYLAGEKNPMYGKNAWDIAASRKTPEEVEATRQSKREKMKAFWANHPEAKEAMAAKTRGRPSKLKGRKLSEEHKAKLKGRIPWNKKITEKEVCHDANRV